MITPDDFSGRPYVGGLNQLGHTAAGAAMLWLFLWVLPMWWAVMVAGGLILALEVYQLKFMGAKGKDYAADLLYWYAGVACWGVWPEHLPPLLMAAFVIEYVRIKWRT